ncbi:MAG: hypothetical protein HY566_02250 [Candidatus Kerfeldbacteria bacterium]|nr:hypothetical protein [Candidatus Kerfeldbacteria bacterium]
MMSAVSEQNQQATGHRFSILLPFLLLFLPFAILPFHLVQIGHQNDWVAFSNERGGVTWYVWLVLVPMTVLGSWLLYRLPLAAFNRLSVKLVVAGAVLLAIPLFFSPPIFSGDIYHSLFYGESSTLGLNPYLTTVADRPASVYAPSVFFGYDRLPAPYGPLWLRLMQISSVFFGDNVAANILFLRCLMLFAHILLVLVAASLLMADSATRKKTILMFAWSPALLLFTVSELHSDVLVGLGIGLAVLAARRRRMWVSLLIITTAGLLKPTALIIAPLLMAWYLATEGKKAIARLLFSTLVSTALALLIVMPLWAGTKTFDGIRQQAALVSTTYIQTPLAFFLTGRDHTLPVRTSGLQADELVRERLLTQPIQNLRLPSTAVRGATLLSMAAFAAIFFWIAMQLLRKKLPLIFMLLSALMALLFFGMHWFMPWYILWVLPLALAEFRVAKVTALYLLALIPALFYQPVLGMIFFGFVAGFVNALLRAFRNGDAEKTA